MAADKGNKELFENMPVSKALWTLCVPTVISQLIVLIYSLADTFYVGRTNNPYMVAAASLILPVYNISISLAGIAGVGGGSLISRHLGAGKYPGSGGDSDGGPDRSHLEGLCPRGAREG